MAVAGHRKHQQPNDPTVLGEVDIIERDGKNSSFLLLSRIVTAYIYILDTYLNHRDNRDLYSACLEEYTPMRLSLSCLQGRPLTIGQTCAPHSDTYGLRRISSGQG